MHIKNIYIFTDIKTVEKTKRTNEIERKKDRKRKSNKK